MFSFIKDLDKSRRTLLYACFYAFFCNGMIALTQGSMMPDMKAAYGLTDTAGGLMLSAHSIGNLAAGFLSGVVGVYIGRKRTAILLNAGAALYITGKAPDMKEGVKLAAEILDSGAALKTYEDFVRVSNGN